MSHGRLYIALLITPCMLVWVSEFIDVGDRVSSCMNDYLIIIKSKTHDPVKSGASCKTDSTYKFGSKKIC